MRINADFSKPTIVHGARQDWIASPAPGVDRRMLFRIGDEKARATSIVRYAPGSAFPRHTHPGGEEFVVVEGIFQDEHGDYPSGSYIRNPPGTSHVPASAVGCTIFVRLWQFRETDRAQTVRLPGEGNPERPRSGAETATVLFNDGFEEVRLETWNAAESIEIHNPTGLELFVISGSLGLPSEMLEYQSWVRLPAGVALYAKVGTDGAKVWMKCGPLRHQDACAD